MGSGAATASSGHILLTSSPPTSRHLNSRLVVQSRPRINGGRPLKMLPFNPISLSTKLAAVHYDDVENKNNRQRTSKLVVRAISSSSSSSAVPDKPVPNSSSFLISDILWPAAGAFAAMALLGKIDQILAPKGVSLTIAPLGAVCAVLFLTPTAPAAKKYNMFMAHIGCAAIGVLTYSLLGATWTARSVSLSLSIAFMALTRCTHPPAAGLPLLYIDGAKFHHLSYWFAVFPAAAACIILSLIQEVVSYLKEKVKF